MSAPVRVAVTLSQDALPGLAEALEALGAELLWTPLLRFAEPDDWGPVDQAIGRLDEYRALALTSPRAATAFADRIGMRTRTLLVPITWAAGDGTASAWSKRIGPVKVPRSKGAEGAGEAVARAIIAARNPGPVLYPCGEEHRDELVVTLRAAGRSVDEVVCYRSILAGPAMAEAALHGAAVVVVGSPRVARLVGTHAPESARLLALGPTTAAAFAESGRQAVVAEWPTVDGVVAAMWNILRRLAAPPSSGRGPG